MLLKKTLEITLNIKEMLRFICKRQRLDSYHYQMTIDVIHIKQEKAEFQMIFGISCLERFLHRKRETIQNF